MRCFTATCVSTAMAIGALLVVPLPAAGQGLTDRPADPRDVGSVDGIIRAFYDVVSGPAGQPRDWARDSTLYLQGLEFVIVDEANGSFRPRVVDHATYARTSAATFGRGFFEREIYRVSHRFGPIMQVFSTYEWRRTEDGPVGGRGINSIELVWDGTRWWIASAVWTDETAANPIPAEYLPRAPRGS